MGLGPRKKNSLNFAVDLDKGADPGIWRQRLEGWLGRSEVFTSLLSINNQPTPPQTEGADGPLL